MPTQSQAARLAGFNQSLAIRGVNLWLDGTDTEFVGLIEDLGESPEDFAVAQEQRVYSRVHILRSADGIGEVKFGDVFIEKDSGRTHTIRACAPNDIKHVFTCDTNTPEAPNEA